MAPPACLTPAKAKPTTLAALLLALAVVAIVTAAFVLLHPARITISVARTGSSGNMPRTAGGGGGGSGLELNFTLVADNPSRRAKVRYDSMFVDVSNNTAPGGQWDNYNLIRAEVTTTMPLWQPGRTAAIDATVSLADAPWIKDFTRNMRFSVMVTAQARFRVGVVWTRLYDIKVSCSPVAFPATAKVKPAGAATAGSASSLPVICV